jgi:hypothetical protein
MPLAIQPVTRATGDVTPRGMLAIPPETREPRAMRATTVISKMIATLTPEMRET